MILIREIWASFIATAFALLVSYVFSANLIEIFGANGVSVTVIISYSTGLFFIVLSFILRLKAITKCSR